jgi:hypothetical protein
LRENGAEAVQFLVDHVTVLGLEIQNWMLIATALVAAFIVFAWTSRDRG